MTFICFFIQPFEEKTNILQPAILEFLFYNFIINDIESIEFYVYNFVDKQPVIIFNNITPSL